MKINKNKKAFEISTSLLIKIVVGLLLLAIVLLFIAKSSGVMNNVNIPGF